MSTEQIDTVELMRRIVWLEARVAALEARPQINMLPPATPMPWAPPFYVTSAAAAAPAGNTVTFGAIVERY